MVFFKILSALLHYPNDEFYAHLPEIRDAVEKLEGVSDEERSGLLAFIDWMRSQESMQLQADYVQTFDLNAEHSLHLTHHLFGDDRGRGPALVDLGEFYRSSGFEVADGELPDYLPLILEFLSTVDELGTRVFLGDAAKVLTVLAQNLEKAQSPYAPLVRMLESRGQLLKKVANS